MIDGYIDRNVGDLSCQLRAAEKVAAGAKFAWDQGSLPIDLVSDEDH